MERQVRTIFDRKISFPDVMDRPPFKGQGRGGAVLAAGMVEEASHSRQNLNLPILAFSRMKGLVCTDRREYTNRDGFWREWGSSIGINAAKTQYRILKAFSVPIASVFQPQFLIDYP